MTLAVMRESDFKVMDADGSTAVIGLDRNVFHDRR